MVIDKLGEVNLFLLNDAALAFLLDYLFDDLLLFCLFHFYFLLLLFFFLFFLL